MTYPQNNGTSHDTCISPQEWKIHSETRSLSILENPVIAHTSFWPTCGPISYQQECNMRSTFERIRYCLVPARGRRNDISRVIGCGWMKMLLDFSWDGAAAKLEQCTLFRCTFSSTDWGSSSLYGFIWNIFLPTTQNWPEKLIAFLLFLFNHSSQAVQFSKNRSNPNKTLQAWNISVF